MRSKFWNGKDEEVGEWWASEMQFVEGDEEL